MQRGTGNRVRPGLGLKRVNERTGKEVDHKDIVKGYEDRARRALGCGTRGAGPASSRPLGGPCDPAVRRDTWAPDSGWRPSPSRTCRWCGRGQGGPLPPVLGW
ncbi:hypothetical protein [Streptacidiphilus melanogenes]|uniref:hypothetical protein n=1 Tax=Streptacidiphilus melanogenes TaxID=411235 RepID=UPI003F6E8607